MFDFGILHTFEAIFDSGTWIILRGSPFSYVALVDEQGYIIRKGWDFWSPSFNG